MSIFRRKEKISKKALNHSSKGEFEYEERKPIKMLGGGHGQKNIDYLVKNKIELTVLSHYSNTVRLGNISIHRREKCRTKGQQCWFPENWTTDDIKKAGLHVSQLKKNQNANCQIPKTGYYKGVKVGIYAINNKVKTIFPWYIQKGDKYEDNGKRNK